MAEGTWVDVGPPNNPLKEVLEPTLETFDSVYSFLIKTFSTVTEVLDFVATLAQGLSNPLYALINEIVALLEQLLEGFRKAGFYFTFDDALQKDFKLANFLGGYRRFQDEITKKLTNPEDPTRPDFSRKTAVFSLTFYAQAGVANVGEEVRGLIEAIRKINDVSRLFELTQRKPVFAPPTILPVKQFVSEDGFVAELSEFPPDEVLNGFELEWETTPSKSTKYVEIDLPPASYVITVTTRAEPLPLYVKTTNSSSSNPQGSAIEYRPIYASENSTRQATTLSVHSNSWLDVEVLDIFAKSGEVYVPYKDVGEETKIYYFNTSNLGAVFGGVNYSQEMLFEALPTKVYDVDSQRYVEDVENYYIYIRAHQTELSGLEDGQEIEAINFPVTVGGDIDAYVKNDTKRGVYFLANRAKLLNPEYSAPQVVSFRVRQRMLYIHAMKEALFYFMVYSEFAFDRGLETASSLKRLYSLFGVKDAKGLRKKYSSDRDDVNDFRSAVLEEIEGACLTAISRGLPTSSTLNSLNEHIERLAESPLYLTLEQEFKEDLEQQSDTFQIGTFPDVYLGYNNKEGRDNPLASARYTPVKNIYAPRGLDNVMYQYANGVTKPLYNFLLEDYNNKLKSAGFMFNSVRDTKDVQSPTGAWIKKDFFVDVYFVELLQSLKLVLGSLENYIQGLLKYIEILKQRIESMRAFVQRIRSLLLELLALRFPAGVSYLYNVSEGTQGVVESFSSAGNKPPSGDFVSSTYATVVIGGAPVAVVNLITAILGEE